MVKSFFFEKKIWVMAIFGENNAIFGKNPSQAPNPLILAYFYLTNFAKTDQNFNIEKNHFKE